MTDDRNFVGIKQLCINNITTMILLGFTLLSTTIYYMLYKIVLKAAPVRKFVKSRIEDNESHLSYLAAYILPFVGLNFSTWQTVASSVVLFYVLGSVYIKTNLILTNPTLTLFGFCISKVEITEGKDIFIIHKETIIKDKEYNCIELINNIFIHKV
ncbi:MAG: hypothetical protein LBG18_06990 [Mediterranea sp.]|nr:hypothetical protein [Mediterranea sp.]